MRQADTEVSLTFRAALRNVRLVEQKRAASETGSFTVRVGVNRALALERYSHDDCGIEHGSRDLACHA